MASLRAARVGAAAARHATRRAPQVIANAGVFYALAAADRVVPGGAAPAAGVVAAATAALRAKFWPVMRANWIVWPLPSLINLVVVPLEYRVLFTNVVAVVWKCVLSLATRKS